MFGKSRHISIRYFFVKDRVDKNEVSIEYCPSHVMIADYFTKPLQGRLFCAMRAVIMGHKSLEWLKTELSPIKERVNCESKSRAIDVNYCGNNKTELKNEETEKA